MITLLIGAALVSSGVTWMLSRPRSKTEPAPVKPSNVTASGFTCAECGVGKTGSVYVMTCGTAPRPIDVRARAR